MRNFLTTSFAILSMFTLPFAVGCEGEEPQDEPAPDFDGEAGQEVKQNTEVAYPEVTGLEVGKVIPDFTFYGFANPAIDNSDAARVHIHMSDFYNPTGEGVFPEGSVHGAGNPMPKALLIVVSAVWCVPCQYENEEVLPVEFAEFAPRGGQFLLQLADGPDYGVPALFNHLVGWTNKYDTAWPAVIDPSSKLSVLFEQQAFPANMIVDTKTMILVDSIAGVPPEGGPFMQKFEDLLDP